MAEGKEERGRDREINRKGESTPRYIFDLANGFTPQLFNCFSTLFFILHFFVCNVKKKNKTCAAPFAATVVATALLVY